MLKSVSLIEKKIYCNQEKKKICFIKYFSKKYTSDSYMILLIEKEKVKVIKSISLKKSMYPKLNNVGD